MCLFSCFFFPLYLSPDFRSVRNPSSLRKTVSQPTSSAASYAVSSKHLDESEPMRKHPNLQKSSTIPCDKKYSASPLTSNRISCSSSSGKQRSQSPILSNDHRKTYLRPSTNTTTTGVDKQNISSSSSPTKLKLTFFEGFRNTLKSRTNKSEVSSCSSECDVQNSGELKGTFRSAAAVLDPSEKDSNITRRWSESGSPKLVRNKS